MKNKLSQILLWLLIIIVSGFVGFLIVKFVSIPKVETDEPWQNAMILVSVFIVAHLVIAFHELGHLLAGVLQGFKFQMYVVGFLGVKRGENGIQFYLNKNMGHYGGVASTLPVDQTANNARKFAIVLLAGPVFSLILAILLYLMHQQVSESGIWRFNLFLGSAVSFGIFLATTLPSSTGAFFTDRKRFQRLVMPGKDREVELAILAILAAYGKDNSYRNVNYNDIELLISDDHNFIKLFGLSSAICYQFEIQGIIEDSILNEYELIKQKFPKSVRTTFDKEIEKYKLRSNDGTLTFEE